MLFWLAEQGQDSDRRTALGICSRIFERITKLLTTVLERKSDWLMPHVPDLLSLYLQAGLLRVSAADIQRMRSKRAYLMLRLLCTFLVVTKSHSRGEGSLLDWRVPSGDALVSLLV